MPTVGYARVSSAGQDLGVQLEKLKGARCDKVFKEKRSGVDAGRPELKRCLDYVRDGDTFLVTKLDRLARSTSDLYRIVSNLPTRVFDSRCSMILQSIQALVQASSSWASSH